MSESTLSKLFRSRMGSSFHQFVVQRRLIAAKRLLETDAPLTQIAEEVGFCDYSAFYRAFRKIYRLSPSEYRAYILTKQG